MATYRLLTVLVLLALSLNLKVECDTQLRAEINKEYQYPIRSSGGSGRYRYEARGLPAGMRLQGAVLAGIPTIPGLYNIQLTAFDDAGRSAEKIVQIMVANSNSQSNLKQDASFTTVPTNTVTTTTITTVERPGSSIQTTSTRSSSQTSSISLSRSSNFVSGSSFAGTGTIFYGPYERSSAGLPIFQVNNQGAYVYVQDSDGNFILPRDPQGYNIYPYDSRGYPLLPKNRNARLIFPLDSRLQPALPRNRDGFLVYPIDSQGNPVIPMDSTENMQYPTDARGNPILPSMTPMSVDAAFPISNTGSTSQVTTNQIMTQPLLPMPEVPKITSQTTQSKTTRTMLTTSTAQVNQVQSQPTYPTGLKASFPTRSMPTGPSKDYMQSTAPLQISNYQYEVVQSRDTYKPTQLDIQAQAVFLRQINANKAVANLLSIMQALTANVNGVQEDIPAATSSVNQALAYQRQTQTAVTAAENANKTLATNIQIMRNNINELQSSLSKTKFDLDAADQSLGKITIQSTTHTQSIRSSQGRLISLKQALADTNQIIRQTNDQMSQAREIVVKATKTINTIKDQANSAPAMRQNLQADLTRIRQRIVELQQELATVRKQLSNTQQKANYYADLPSKSVGMIREQQQQIDMQTSRMLTVLQPKLDKAQQTLKEVKEAIADNEAKLSIARTSLTSITTNTAVVKKSKDDLVDRYNTLVAAISSSTAQFNRMVSNVPVYHKAVMDSYQVGNDANDRVQHTKTVLQTLQQKYIDSMQQLSQAKQKLEAARSEKEIADLAVNEQIKKQGGSTVLPFSIPNAYIARGIGGQNMATGGILNDGVNKGANGQPKVFVDGVKIETPNSAVSTSNRMFSINSRDLTHFISGAYTAGVDPTKLFPFVFGGRRARFECRSVESFGDRSAAITNIGSQGLEATEDGVRYKIVMGDQTKFMANRQDYVPRVGDQIRWRGCRVSPMDRDNVMNQVNAQEVACFA